MGGKSDLNSGFMKTSLQYMLMDLLTMRSWPKVLHDTGIYGVVGTIALKHLYLGLFLRRYFLRKNVLKHLLIGFKKRKKNSSIHARTEPIRKEKQSRSAAIRTALVKPKRFNVNLHYKNNK